MKRVVRETRRLYADQGWAVGTCEEAFWWVWTNKRDDLRRQRSGKAEAHRLSAKNSKRVRSKLESRMKAIATIDWPEKKKEKVLPLLRKELTSPMVSDEEDENLLLSTAFWWESKKLSSYKRQLDYQRLFKATARGRKNMKMWGRHPTEVQHADLPLDMPSWAVKIPVEEDQLNNTADYDS
ncbi:uncharacterized protein LOC124277737 [Haliotis rubra]|uniref:uncharacterized protein LOC124277737 n=1 Tax=Haliotis rubra TaxID=36100 RepID=UPI001EE52FB4|nr:uncharacterized protein LOC124277737 [Haliotis rubra]